MENASNGSVPSSFRKRVDVSILSDLGSGYSCELLNEQAKMQHNWIWSVIVGERRQKTGRGSVLIWMQTMSLVILIIWWPPPGLWPKNPLQASQYLLQPKLLLKLHVMLFAPMHSMSQTLISNITIETDHAWLDQLQIVFHSV